MYRYLPAARAFRAPMLSLCFVVLITPAGAENGPAGPKGSGSMLSLVDVTGSLTAPLGLEDWTTAPEAAHASQLLPGASVGRTWRLRMIQEGRFAVYATAVSGTSGAVTNSPPILLDVTARVGACRRRRPRHRVQSHLSERALVQRRPGRALRWGRLPDIGHLLARAPPRRSAEGDDDE